jgi:hypothetical protein
MRACQRIAEVSLLVLALCIAACGVASAETVETWEGTVSYANQSGRTNGASTATVSTDGAVTGAGSGLWDSIMEEEMDFKVTGTRDADSFHLTIEASGKGDAWRLDVTAPIIGNLAGADVNKNAPAGTFPQAEVRLVCQDCS